MQRGLAIQVSLLPGLPAGLRVLAASSAVIRRLRDVDIIDLHVNGRVLDKAPDGFVLLRKPPVDHPGAQPKMRGDGRGLAVGEERAPVAEIGRTGKDVVKGPFTALPGAEVGGDVRGQGFVAADPRDVPGEAPCGALHANAARRSGLRHERDGRVPGERRVDEHQPPTPFTPVGPDRNRDSRFLKQSDRPEPAGLARSQPKVDNRRVDGGLGGFAATYDRGCFSDTACRDDLRWRREQASSLA